MEVGLLENRLEYIGWRSFAVGFWGQRGAEGTVQQEPASPLAFSRGQAGLQERDDHRNKLYRLHILNTFLKFIANTKPKHTSEIAINISPNTGAHFRPLPLGRVPKE